MDLHYKREVTVGTLVVAGFAAFVIGTMWLKGKDFKTGDHTRIEFSNVGSLKEASPVQVAGVLKGKVQKITLIDQDHVIVEISLAKDAQPRLDAAASIVSLNLTGDAGVAFRPGLSPAMLPKGQIIKGTMAPGIGDVMAKLSARGDSILTNIQHLVDTAMVSQLRATTAAAQQTLLAARRTMEIYGNPNAGPTYELTRTMSQFRELGARLDSTLANPALQRALGKSDSLASSLREMSAQFARTSARLDTILGKIQRGEGSIGKLMTDTTFYQNVANLTASLDSILAQIKKDPGKIQLTVPVKIF